LEEARVVEVAAGIVVFVIAVERIWIIGERKVGDRDGYVETG
jgi:hypothetical protein